MRLRDQRDQRERDAAFLATLRPAAMPALTTSDLKAEPLDPLTLEIGAGECLALTAPSGAGKTRLLRAIADLDPHAGEAYLDGEACTSMPAPEWRRRVGYLPPEPRWWHATVGEHFAAVDGQTARIGERRAAMEQRRAAPAERRVADALTELVKRLGFPGDVWAWPVERLSSGETQRLALARLLELEPDALLLDEPTAHLDDDYTRVVESIVAEYRAARDAPVIWVTHDIEQAERVGTRRAVLVGGELDRAGDGPEADGDRREASEP